MPRPYDVITFDCYGTLIDWEGGITEAFAREAAADGVRIDAAHALREYSRTEPLVEQERYRPYREVLSESAVRVARSLGWPIAYSRGIFLPDSLPRWKPFPDTNAALERLRNAGEIAADAAIADNAEAAAGQLPAHDNLGLALRMVVGGRP